MFKPMSHVKTVDISWTGGGEYVTHRYRDVVVVFDGYGSTNTKGITHQRRSKGNAGTTVTFTGDTPVTL